MMGLWGRTFKMGKGPVLLNRDPSWGLHVATRNTFLSVHSLHPVLGGTKAIITPPKEETVLCDREKERPLPSGSTWGLPPSLLL